MDEKENPPIKQEQVAVYISFLLLCGKLPQTCGLKQYLTVSLLRVLQSCSQVLARSGVIFEAQTPLPSQLVGERIHFLVVIGLSEIPDFFASHTPAKEKGQLSLISWRAPKNSFSGSPHNPFFSFFFLFL